LREKAGEIYHLYKRVIGGRVEDYALMKYISNTRFSKTKQRCRLRGTLSAHEWEGKKGNLPGRKVNQLRELDKVNGTYHVGNRR